MANAPTVAKTITTVFFSFFVFIKETITAFVVNKIFVFFVF